MVRRYFVPCVVIIAVALVGALASYKTSYKKRFSASCTFQIVLVPQPANQVLSVDGIDANNRLAAAQLQIAIATGLYGATAAEQGVKPALLAGNVVTNAQPGLGLFATRVIARDAKTAVALDNAICSKLVTAIAKQRTDQINEQVAQAQGRMDSVQTLITALEKVPAKKRTTSQKVQLKAQAQALNTLGAQIAQLLSQSPGNIIVIKPAGSGSRYDPRSLRKNLLIALAAGILACLLFIMVAEIVLERARSRAASR